MVKYSTKDYAKPTIRTSAIPETGIVIVYRGIRSTETKFNKDMFLVDCIHDGKESDMIFNSVKLAKVFTENHDALVGKSVRIIPEGSGAQREYTVDDA